MSTRPYLQASISTKAQCNIWTIRGEACILPTPVVGNHEHSYSVLIFQQLMIHIKFQSTAPTWKLFESQMWSLQAFMMHGTVLSNYSMNKPSDNVQEVRWTN